MDFDATPFSLAKQRLWEELTLTHGWLTSRTSGLSSSTSSDSSDTVEIPKVLKSIETLDFLGFTKAASHDIITSFHKSALYKPAPDGFLECAKAYVHACKDATTPEHDWAAAIDGMGIKPVIRDQILDERFTRLRLTASARFWVQDTITAKYRLLAAREGRGQNNQTLPRMDDREMRQVLDIEADLMKGGDATSLRSEIRAAVGLPSDSVSEIPNFDRCQTRPGVLSAMLSRLKFSKHRMYAERYASYMRVRVREQGQDIMDVGILHLVLPKQLLPDCISANGPSWKELVQTERRRLWLEVFPKDKDKLAGFEDVDLDAPPEEKIDDWHMIKADDVPRDTFVGRQLQRLWGTGS